MSFVRLENLNDFIQPGATCVKPIEKKTPGLVAKVSDINLSDCLACSGCITSAETVLVQQQNYEELFKVINDNKTSKVSPWIKMIFNFHRVIDVNLDSSLPFLDKQGDYCIHVVTEYRLAC